MKRVSVLILVCVLLFALPACSGVKLTDPEEISPGNNTTVVRDYEDGDLQSFSDYLAQEQERAEQEQAAQQPAQAGAAEGQGQEAVAVDPPRRGKWENNVYINEYLGLKYDPRVGWLYYDDEEIAQLVGQDATVHTLENLISEDSPVDSIYEMMTVDMQNNNVVICYENLGKTGFGSYTEAEYLRSVYLGLSAQEGYTCAWEERSSHTLGNHEYKVLPVTLQSGGSTYQQGHYIRKMGQYFVQIIITATPDAYPVVLNSFEGL